MFKALYTDHWSALELLPLAKCPLVFRSTVSKQWRKKQAC